MKLKKLMILFGTVCILNTMAAGCGSAAEPTVKTKEAQSGEILPEEETNTPLKDNDKDTAESQENTSGKWQVLEPDIAAAVDADFLGKVKIAWDEFIAEPFFEWWNSVGKAKFAGFAQDIGIGIGTGLKAGIMTLLGIDLGETFDEGSSIGASFAKGFFEGFDFDAVSGALWQGFKNMLSSAGKLLPGGASADLSSVLSVVMLGKIATPFINMGKGAGSIGKWLFGANAATGISRISALMGSTGNAMVSGSGMLGKLANVGYGLTGGGTTAGMYFGNMAGAMSGGTAALIGAGSVAGGIAGAAGILHGGVDLYTGFTTDDEEKAKAYKKAGAIEVGGTLAGAGAGAATMEKCSPTCSPWFAQPFFLYSPRALAQG